MTGSPPDDRLAIRRPDAAPGAAVRHDTLNG